MTVNRYEDDGDATHMTGNAIAGELKALVQRVGSLEEAQRQLLPLLLERSGRIAEFEGVKRDLNSAHARHRDHEREIKALAEIVDKNAAAADARMNRIEDRYKTIINRLIGGFAVLQGIGALVTWFLSQKGTLW